MKKRARLIAHYLPQFHPIPENDEWWGDGFTEWTNVKKALPLFEGHQQPVLPGELGYYDLRDPEVREKQASLAKEHGIEGFCYWHYWFGNGKRILEKVFDEVLESGNPDFPFCLAWANESWTGIWHGAKDRVLMEQKYPGKEDYISHFQFLIKAFRDKRYITVNGKPLFMVYRPQEIPVLEEFVSIFRQEALKNGLNGLYLVGNNAPDGWNPHAHGFDAIAPTGLHLLKSGALKIKEKLNRVSEKLFNTSIKTILPKGPLVYEYNDYYNILKNKKQAGYTLLPCIISNWDNTPRSGENGWVLNNATPDLFRKVLKESILSVSKYDGEEKIIFIKSWNEWAEGNYIEPDQKNGSRYLDVCKDEIFT